MNINFKDPASNQLWESYFANIKKYCVGLNQRQSEDIENEIKAHLFESFINQSGSELEKLQISIEKLGEPESFMSSWVEDRLLEQMAPGQKVRSLWSLSRLNPKKGLKQLLVNLLIGMGYLFAFYFFSVAVLKVFFPDNIGLFTFPNGVPFIGFVESSNFKEHLGYWIIPIGLMASFLLQYVLSKWLKKMIAKK